jgi:hypothetical protein
MRLETKLPLIFSFLYLPVFCYFTEKYKNSDNKRQVYYVSIKAAN